MVIIMKGQKKNMTKVLNYKGHIRNRAALCAELGVADTADREATEKAVIAAAYDRFGKDMAAHLYGAFAFVLQSENGLFAMRDHFGIEPLYYAVAPDGELLIDTSLEGLFAGGKLEKALEERMLPVYFTYAFPAGEYTFYRGVKKLLPGHMLSFDGKNLTVERYFRPSFAVKEQRDEEEWMAMIDSTVETIMAEEYEDTVKSNGGAFLSSGVDSSCLVAASAVKYACAVGYHEERFSELAGARETAGILDRTLYERIVEPAEYFAAIDRLLVQMEQPLGDGSSAAFYLGSMAMKDHSTMCFSGEGNDEFWGGYYSYGNAERYASDIARPYRSCCYIGASYLLKNPEMSDLMDGVHEAIYAETEDQTKLSRMMLTDILLYLDGNIYPNIAAMAKLCGLDIRMPFSDVRLFDIAARVPDELKLRTVGEERISKYIFRRASCKYLPEPVAFRKKIGFAVPIRFWLQEEKYHAPIRALTTGETAAKYLDTEAINGLWDRYLAGEDSLWRPLYTAYSFVKWYDAHFGGENR